MSERASQTAQRYVDAMNIASAKIEQLQAEVEELREKVRQHEVVFKVQAEALKSAREQVQRVRELHRSCLTVSVEDGGCRLSNEHPSEEDPAVCLHCDWDDFPCPTIRALDGDA